MYVIWILTACVYSHIFIVTTAFIPDIALTFKVILFSGVGGLFP